MLWSNMYRTPRSAPSTRHSDTVLTMVNRPPKPPCWRDFLPDGRKPNSSGAPSSSSSRPKGKHEALQFTDLSEIPKTNTGGPEVYATATPTSTVLRDPAANAAPVSVINPPSSATLPSQDTVTNASQEPPATTTTAAQSSQTLGSLAKQQDKVSRALAKRHKKKQLHRTRSQFAIEREHLPEVEDMTVNLGDTKSQEYGVLRRHMFDARQYIEENTRRCERWLEAVQASEPLDDIAFTKGTGVEIEIPEEDYAHILPGAVMSSSLDTSASSTSGDSDIDSVSISGASQSLPQIKVTSPQAADTSPAAQTTKRQQGGYPYARSRSQEDSPSSIQPRDTGVVAQRKVSLPAMRQNGTGSTHGSTASTLRDNKSLMDVSESHVPLMSPAEEEGGDASCATPVVSPQCSPNLDARETADVYLSSSLQADCNDIVLHHFNIPGYVSTNNNGATTTQESGNVFNR